MAAYTVGPRATTAISRAGDHSYFFWITCEHQHHILRSWPCRILLALHTRLGIDVGGGLAWYSRSYPLHRPTSEALAIFGLALIAAAVIFLHEADSYPGWRALVPTMGAALVIWCGSTLISSRILVAIGLISYPIYLWHWPALWVARETGQLQNTGGRIVVISAAIALAWLTFVFVERPIRSGWRPTATFAPLITSAIVVAIMGAAISIDGVPSRWPAGLNALTSYKFDENAIYRIKRCHLLLDQRPEEFAPECFTNQQAGPTVVLWGDSAATALHPGIQAVMGDRYNIAELTASACPPFGADYIPLSERPLCGEVNAFVLSYIAKTQPDVVLLSAAPNYPGVDIAKYTRSTIIALKLIGIRRVIVVGPPPMWPEAMPKLILKAYLKNERADFPDKLDLPSTVESASEAVDQSLKDVTEQAGASYVSAYHTLCDGRTCLAMLKLEPIAWDMFHLTVPASTKVAQEIERAILAVAD